MKVVAYKDLNCLKLKICGLGVVVSLASLLWCEHKGYSTTAYYPASFLMAFVSYLLMQVCSLRNSIMETIAAYDKTGNSNSLQSVFMQITQGNKEAETFLESLRKGESLPTFNHLSKTDGLGKKLTSLSQKLSDYDLEEQKRKWSQDGLAHFNTLLRSGNSLEEFSGIILSNLIKYLGANQGGLFIEEKREDGTRFLEMKACYAYDRKKFLKKTIEIGEGLLGESMREQSTVFLTDIPADYILISSGLGHSSPTSILIVPLMFSAKYFGVLEIATFEVLEPYQIEMIEKVSAEIAAEIATKRAVFDTEKLLKQSQNLASELQAQEEEIRQNMEELSATQEEMERKQSELNSVFSAINNTVASVEFNPEGKIISANSIFLSVGSYQETEFLTLTYDHLLSEKEKLKPQHQMMWSSLKDKKFFSGEFKFINRSGQEMYLTGTFNPILNTQGDLEKIIMIAQFTTQDKVKQIELTSAVSALKNTAPFVELDVNFKCKSANDLFLKLTGLKRLELKSRNFHSFLQEESSERLSSNFEIFSAQEFYEEKLFYKLDTPTGYRTTFTPVRDLDNNITRYLVVLADKIYDNQYVSELVI